MLERWPDREAAFLRQVAVGDFELVQLTPADLKRMAELVLKYADLPLGATDASVVAVAERWQLTDVATIDHRHFSIVRPSHVPRLSLLP